VRYIFIEFLVLNVYACLLVALSLDIKLKVFTSGIYEKQLSVAAQAEKCDFAVYTGFNLARYDFP
jgi:hypothetical protein